MRKHLNSILGLAIKSTKLLKSLKVLKVMLSVASMALFGFCETWVMGAALAFSLVLLLFLHEIGHALALKAKGFGMKLPFFVPFLGAIIFAPKFKDRDTEAYVGLAGPIFGTLAAVLFAVPYLFAQHKLWLTGSVMGVSLNLFNMVPISPFDGGRVTQAADQRLRYVGYAALMAFTVVVGEPGMLILWIMVLSDAPWSDRSKLRWMQFVWVVMAALTVARVGRNHWANAIDCGLGLFFVLACTAGEAYRRRHHEKLIVEMMPEKEMREEVMRRVEEERAAERESLGDHRPLLDVHKRTLWFLAWGLLVVVQVWIMLSEIHLIK